MTTHTTTETRTEGAAAVSAIYPCLFYRDALGAIDFLCRAFGFEKRFVMADPDGTVKHSELSLGTSVIMVGSSRTDQPWRSPLDLGAATATVCLYISDPDAHHARAVAAGAKIAFPLKDEDYGARSYTAIDNEGTYWTFGTYIPGEYWDGKKG